MLCNQKQDTRGLLHFKNIEYNLIEFGPFCCLSFNLIWISAHHKPISLLCQRSCNIIDIILEAADKCFGVIT